MRVDFPVDLKKELEISVPIRYVGEENRANDGGIVATLLWKSPFPVCQLRFRRQLR